MKFRVISIAAAGALLSIVAVSLALAAGPDPAEMYIQSVQVEGSGCPQGSVGTSIANDRQSMTLIFDSYVAATGPAVASPEARKDCTLFLTVRVPQGTALTEVTTDARGYVQLPDKVRGVSSLVMGGATRATFHGPVAKDYISTHTRDIQTETDACNATQVIEVHSAVQLTPAGGKSQGQITVDSLDLKLTHLSGESTRVC